MNERLMRDVTTEYERMRAEILLMRVELGLSPIHDLRYCVRKLYEEGREAFEKARGPRCQHSHEWQPRS